MSSKIITFLLLSAFLLASTGNLFGLAWCVGNDGHVEVSYSNADNCCAKDSARRGADRYGLTNIRQSDGENCGLCLDFSTKPGEAVFLKRLKRNTTASIAAIFPNRIFASTIESTRLPVSKRVPRSPTRISQTILTHRTVVLLC